ncbi:hypothetical protein OG946_13455 [Streptomyces sp. NBC_01808]|uniref:hypothetical protein n=1 Tax=Streptomyces sp. NBC_01808 TaxID=2975947 RepID=UPI002DDB8313|nr:hypothetical protein [Streptomyces sp. NBC_01808]WSA38290.1 hypothetical protein OG946_13455 [Streptomyces sp. NBC_01808]
MEENKGLKVTPVNAAAMDPAALPGLVPSPPDEKEKEQDEAETTDEKKESEDSADAADDDSDKDEADKAESAEKDAEGDDDKDADEDKATASGDSEADDSDDSDDSGSDADGPVFEAADRRGSVTVDSTGVRFQLDDTEAEFTWPEIGAVEYKTSRFGRRLVLSVHDSRGICPAEVEAPDKATLKTWAADLESALDAYFEDSSS